MAKIFGIEEEELNDLPEPLQNAIKNSHQEMEELRATASKVTDLETKVAKLTGDGSGDGDDPNKTKTPPANNTTPGPHNNWLLTMEQRMIYDTRRDQLLANYQTGTDKQLSVCVSKFRQEITTELEKSHPAYAANDNYVKNVIAMVAGRHLGEILNSVRANDGNYNDFFSERSSGGPTPPPQKKPVDMLSEEQKRVAKNIGISPEAYADQLVELGVLRV